jgi:lipopolysaccharide transport system permease protein
VSVGAGAVARADATLGWALRLRTAVSELLGARELVLNLVRRDLKVRHRGTFLGMLWSLTTPVLLVALYACIFTFILRASPAQDVRKVPFAVYFFVGLALWNLFSNSISAATASVVGAGYILRKVYFPRAILPLTSVLSSLVTFAFEVSVALVAAVVAVGPPGPQFLWVPAIVLVAVVMAYGLSLLLSAITVFLRDVSHFDAILLQVLFWATPVIYSLQYVGDRPGLVRLLRLNPMTGVVVSFRNVVLMDRPPELPLLAYDLAFAVASLVVGAWVFRRYQRLFSEIV